MVGLSLLFCLVSVLIFSQHVKGISFQRSSLSLISSKKSAKKAVAATIDVPTSRQAKKVKVIEEINEGDNSEDEETPASISSTASSSEDEEGEAETTESGTTTILEEEEEKSGGGSMGLQLAFSAASIIGNQLITKIDFKKKNMHKLGRLLLLWYIRLQIHRLDDETELPDPSEGSGSGMLGGLGAPLLQGLGKNIPGFDLIKGALLGAGAGADGKPRMTVRSYDLSEVSKLSLGLATEALMVLYMDVIARMPYLLLIVPLAGVANKFKAPIVQIHVFRKSARGALSRPFRSAFEKSMSDKLAQQQEQSQEGGEVTEEGGSSDIAVQEVVEEVMVIDGEEDEDSGDSGDSESDAGEGEGEITPSVAEQGGLSRSDSGVDTVLEDGDGDEENNTDDNQEEEASTTTSEDNNNDRDEDTVESGSSSVDDVLGDDLSASWPSLSAIAEEALQDNSN